MPAPQCATNLNSGPAPCHECPRRSSCIGGLLTQAMDGSGRNDSVTRTVIDKGEHLYRLGDHTDWMYVVRSGAVKTYAVSEDGEEEIVSFHGSHTVAGLEGVCVATHRHSSRALTRSWTCRIATPALRRAMGTSEPLRERVLSLLGREFERLHEMLHRERCTAEQRVATFLLSHAEDDAAIELPMSRADLGRYLHLATETVSRVFTRFADRNILRNEAGRCIIVNREALAQAA